MTENEVFEKIKKLMALSQSSNENEASLALKRAQKLMQEYQISMEDVSFSEINEQSESIIPAMRDRVLYTTLASIISKAFGVDFYIRFTLKKNSTATQASQTVFIGPKQRLESACYTYTILSRQACNVKKEFSTKERNRVHDELVMKLSTLDIMEVYKLLNESNLDYDTFVKNTVNREVRRNTKAYVFGWLYKVYEKVYDFASSVEERNLIDNYLSKKHPDLVEMRKSRGSRFTYDQLQAYSSGKSDAEQNVNLFQGIHGRESAKLSAPL